MSEGGDVIIHLLLHFFEAQGDVIVQEVLSLQNEARKHFIRHLADLLNIQTHGWRLSSLVVRHSEVLIPIIPRSLYASFFLLRLEIGIHGSPRRQSLPRHVRRAQAHRSLVHL